MNSNPCGSSVKKSKPTIKVCRGWTRAPPQTKTKMQRGQRWWIRAKQRWKTLPWLIPSSRHPKRCLALMARTEALRKQGSLHALELPHRMLNTTSLDVRSRNARQAIRRIRKSYVETSKQRMNSIRNEKQVFIMSRPDQSFKLLTIFHF